jgi:hypothetical protein
VTTLAAPDYRAGAPEVANGASQGDLAVDGTASASPVAVMGPRETSAGVGTTGGKEATAQPSAPAALPVSSSQLALATQGSGSTEAAAQPSAPAALPVSSSQLAVAPQGSGSLYSGGSTGNVTDSPNEPSRGGADARLVWLLGFGTLFGIGVAILILPWALRRRGRGTRL